MIELITTPITIVSVIIILGIVVESLEKGIGNLSRKETIAFLLAGFALICVMFIF